MMIFYFLLSHAPSTTHVFKREARLGLQMYGTQMRVITEEIHCFPFSKIKILSQGLKKRGQHRHV